MALLAENDCLLLPGVILEIVWVLESGYAYSTAQIVERLKHIFGLPNVYVEEYSALVTALDWYMAGMDFADAQHLALSIHRKTQGFATFDKGIVKMANRLGIRQPITMPR